VLHQPAKRGPVLSPDQPWEGSLSFGNINRGGEINTAEEGREIDEELAAELGVTVEQRRVAFPGQKALVWNNRVRWTRNRLVRKGDLDGSRRGIWAITQKGGSGSSERGSKPGLAVWLGGRVVGKPKPRATSLPKATRRKLQCRNWIPYSSIPRTATR
jgi:hypothetical protein